jgi:hypothetical protein
VGAVWASHPGSTTAAKTPILVGEPHHTAITGTAHPHSPASDWRRLCSDDGSKWFSDETHVSNGLDGQPYGPPYQIYEEAGREQIVGCGLDFDTREAATLLAINLLKPGPLWFSALLHK